MMFTTIGFAGRTFTDVQTVIETSDGSWLMYCWNCHTAFLISREPSPFKMTPNLDRMSASWCSMPSKCSSASARAVSKSRSISSPCPIPQSSSGISSSVIRDRYLDISCCMTSNFCKFDSNCHTLRHLDISTESTESICSPWQTMLEGFTIHHDNILNMLKSAGPNTRE